MSSRHVTEEEVLQTYTLELIGPATGRLSYNENQARWLLPQFATEAEENLTDLLPEGYSVRIRAWDAEEETPDE